MKYLNRLIVLVLLTLPAFGQIRVVTTIPDLKDIVQAIGGDQVSVTSIARGNENIHDVVLKPSHLVAVSRADLFVQIGLSLEHSFVPGLLLKARNRKFRAGGSGLVTCSEGWEPIQVGQWATRGEAVDVHPQGNPHMNLAPSAGRHIASRVLDALVAADAKNKKAYVERHAQYCKLLAKAEARWATIAAKLGKGKVCTYHRDFDYLTAATGLSIVATIEPQPGVPPTPRDLTKLVELLRKEEVRVILTARWSNNNSLRFVAEKCGATVVELPAMVQGTGEPSTWIAMIDRLHQSLEKAFAPAGKPEETK